MTARPSVFFRTPLTCIPAAILRRTDGAGRWCRRRCGATTRDDARRGAIYDARCRNGTTRPWHCVGRCTRWCRQIYDIAAVIRATQVSPLRCGVLVRGIAAVILRPRDVRPRNCGGPTGRARWCRRRCGATTRDDARRGAIYDARCRNGTTRPWHCVGRCTRWCRQIYDIAAVIRATQVSPLRCGVFVHDIAAGRGCQRSTISTTGTVLTSSLFVT